MSSITVEKSIVTKNPLLELETFGQSIWMDFVHRRMISSGELQKVIEEDGISGVTTNPSIFERAISESHVYDEHIRKLTLEGKTSNEIYQSLVVEDIQSVADLLRPTYNKTDGRDGFVSLEVSPRVAHDTTATILEARQLWSAVSRPNTMIKVPATLDGLPAIRQLIGEGINVNITLLFGLTRYREVAMAYMDGLETLAAKGIPLQSVASVASFFLSRIDWRIDPMLEKIRQSNSLRAGRAARLQGQIAIASAKVAYQMYEEISSSDRFTKLENKGARTQRLLWASTSSKNPSYDDTKYVDALVGPDTIITMPLETLNAYGEHGHPERRLDRKIVEAYHYLNELSSLGIDLDVVTQQLEDQGVIKFTSAFNQVMDLLNEKRAAVLRDA